MAQPSMAARHQIFNKQAMYRLYDMPLIIAALGLMAIGLLMVASASMVVSEQQFSSPFHFVIRQGVHLGLGLVLVAMLFRVPMAVWESLRAYLLLAAFALLVAVLIPGIGKQINGSSRWIGIGPIGGQVSEAAKLFIIIYLAGYLHKHNQSVMGNLAGFLKPMMVVGIAICLLLLEPDFGTSIVILFTALGMMFLAGVRLRYFLSLVMIAGILFFILAISSPYRLQRLTTFVNPWAHQFDSGYQLTQSLIAFGQGSVYGMGLGNSVQKLFYLPEAHTDFVFAVLGEELGLVGVSVVVGIFIFFVWRGMRIGYRAIRDQHYFSGFLAYGLSLWIAFQAVINMGVNAGALPTKGLTLPFISYGGSSMLINCCVLGLLLRIDHELRLSKRHRYGF